LFDIRPLATADADEVETLLDAAFGSDRHGRTAYRIRQGMTAVPALSFAAFDDSRLIGSLQTWPIALVTDSSDPVFYPLKLVGPVAVLPERQRQGIGRALMEHMLVAADAGGEDALVLIGDADYYDRLFGFSAVHTGRWQVPGPVDRARLLARLKSERLYGLSGMLGPALVDTEILR